jgi:phosphatidylserine decarboxylase
MKINKEGYKIIAVSGVALAAVWALLYYMIEARESNWLIILISVLLLMFWFFIVSFFREPRRIKIHDADLVFSPCDGRVVVTEVVEDDEYFKGKRLQVSIFMSV